MQFDVRLFRNAIRTFEREMASQLEAESLCCGVTLSQCHTLIEIDQNTGIALCRAFRDS